MKGLFVILTVMIIGWIVADPLVERVGQTWSSIILTGFSAAWMWLALSMLKA